MRTTIIAIVLALSCAPPPPAAHWALDPVPVPPGPGLDVGAELDTVVELDAAELDAAAEGEAGADLDAGCVPDRSCASSPREGCACCSFEEWCPYPGAGYGFSCYGGAWHQFWDGPCAPARDVGWDVGSLRDAGAPDARASGCACRAATPTGAQRFASGLAVVLALAVFFSRR